MLNIVVRSEQPGDLGAISLVTRTAFEPEAFSSHTEQFIVDALRRAGQLTVSLVADNAGAIVGHIAFSPINVSSGEQGWYGLGPVSVLPQWQGQGVGTRLIRSGLEQLQSMGARGCVVLGDPDFYCRFGFKNSESLVYTDAPARYFQAMAFVGEVATGQVQFQKAFEATQ
ncbi:GNAT family N-acetyltransferase [Advenella mimigardefordensis]|uniref:Putative acetyltransferase n=1 Tax=Advenella mimigardefordensis (strain DSM 17166 / LMG 22922 / DPN7) TaxID=1247726 RepID=W0PAD2_ADVMD|nr:N-acetyltransferase [Advenella mimigardefordensis]AHG63799.1 putative acetyltransferase [Advenella mimigardefordensis DPN7]